MRAIAEALGANVGWDQDTRTVTIQRGMHTVVAQIGRKKIFTVLGPRELEVESQVIQNRTMIPVRALETIFSGDNDTPDIQWDGSTKTITINAEPYTDEAALKAFRDNGFAQFSYFRTYFLDEHLNDGSGVAYAIANTMSNIGRWTLDVFTFEFLHYQKNIYKDAVETVLTDIANTKSLKFADTIAEDMAEAIGKEAGFTNDEIEYYIKNDLPDVKLDGVKAKKMKTYAGVLKDAMGSFGKTIKWTKFSLEELACLFTDYTNNIAYLDMMKNAAAEDEDFLEAVNELELEYADWVLKLVFDASDEFRNYLADLVVESSLNLVGSSAASLFSLVTFAMEAGAKLAGAKNYSDNVEDAIALIGIANDLQTYTGEVKDKNYTAAEGLLPTADSETWSELVNAFTATRAALTSGYKCMRAVTEDSGEKAFLDQQIKVLESLAISETLPDTPEGMFRFEK